MSGLPTCGAAATSSTPRSPGSRQAEWTCSTLRLSETATSSSPRPPGSCWPTSARSRTTSATSTGRYGPDRGWDGVEGRTAGRGARQPQQHPPIPTRAGASTRSTTSCSLHQSQAEFTGLLEQGAVTGDRSATPTHACGTSTMTGWTPANAPRPPSACCPNSYVASSTIRSGWRTAGSWTSCTASSRPRSSCASTADPRLDLRDRRHGTDDRAADGATALRPDVKIQRGQLGHRRGGVGDFDASALFEQIYVDPAQLCRTVRRSLQRQPQVGLVPSHQIVSRSNRGWPSWWPTCRLTDACSRSSSTNRRTREVSWQDPTGAHQGRHHPRVTFRAPTTPGHVAPGRRLRRAWHAVTVALAAADRAESAAGRHHLMKGVVYATPTKRLGATCCPCRAQVRDYVAAMGLAVVVDEAEGYAFLRSRPDARYEDGRRRHASRG